MIDQKLEDVYFFWIDRTVKAYRGYSQQELNKLGVKITSDQWVVLKRISEEEGINQKEVANSTFKDPASITRIIDGLEKKGWVERKTGNTDRRSFELFLTKEGKKLVKKVLPLAVDMRAQGLKGITQNELQALKVILNKITKNFE